MAAGWQVPMSDVGVDATFAAPHNVAVQATGSDDEVVDEDQDEGSSGGDSPMQGVAAGSASNANNGQDFPLQAVPALSSGTLVALTQAVPSGDPARVGAEMRVRERIALRKAITEVGRIPEGVLDSSWDGMVGYLRGRLAGN